MALLNNITFLTFLSAFLSAAPCRPRGQDNGRLYVTAVSVAAWWHLPCDVESWLADWGQSDEGMVRGNVV